MTRHSHHGPANQSAAWAEISSQDAIFLCLLRYIISNPSPFVCQCTCSPTVLRAPKKHQNLMTKGNGQLKQATCCLLCLRRRGQ